MANTSRIQSETSGLVDGFKSGTLTAQQFGEKIGEELHAIQDLYSHSNFVELYQQTYPDQTDVSKIPTLKEVLCDDQYAASKPAVNPPIPTTVHLCANVSFQMVLSIRLSQPCHLISNVLLFRFF